MRVNSARGAETETPPKRLESRGSQVTWYEVTSLLTAYSCGVLICLRLGHSCLTLVTCLV
jgi:hypothetical protein